MFTRLITYSQLTPRTLSGDAGYIHNRTDRPLTSAERLVEFGARVCYRSVEKLGHSDVVSGCIQSEHYDVMEHGHAVLYINAHDMNYWRQRRYLNVSTVGLSTYVSGNLRAWYDVVADLRANNVELYAEKLQTHLNYVAPNIFKKPELRTLFSVDNVTDQTYVASFPTIGENVQLIGCSKDIFTDPIVANKLNHATFYINDVSRVMTHQKVRHRWLSFSQESQRYVDIDKGRWGFICPPKIKDDPVMYERWTETIATMENAYRFFRENGIKKEDARFIIPASVETRYVVSGHFYMWQDFLRQRLAKDAQWEIREVATQIHQQLKVVAPHVFDKNNF